MAAAAVETIPAMTHPSPSDNLKYSGTEDGSDTEPFEFNESHHSARLLAGLRHLRDCSQLFDVTLVAEEREFPAHRCVLASCSDYFHAMFTNGLQESSQHTVTLSGVSAGAIEQLIHFAYTSKLKITKENVVAVLSGASHVQILPAVHACERYLFSHLSMDNCCQLEALADLYSLRELRSQVHCFMCKHWLSFSATPDFLSLTSEQLQAILRSDFPVYCSEAEVLRAVVAWVLHRLDDRGAATSSLLSLVKFVPEKGALDLLEEVLQTPAGQRAVCPKLESLLTGLVCDGVETVPGVVNTRGYFQALLLVGGFHQASHSGISNSLLYLDAEAGTLVPYTDIPHMKQADFGLAALKNRLYVVGGCCGEDFLEVTHPFGFCFDPTTNAWTRLPPMSQERCSFYLGAVNGLLYAVGGEVDNSQLLASCEVFDPIDSLWSPIASLPANRSQLAGASLGGKLYVCGGTQDQDEQVRNQLWRYDPGEDRWAQLAPMLQPRADHSMFAHNDRLYVMAGWSKVDVERNPVTAVDCYDPTTDRWSTVTHMKTGRRYCTATLFGGAVYVIGGGKESVMHLQKFREVDVLDLGTMTWRDHPVTLSPIWEHSTVSLHLPRQAGRHAEAL